MTPTVNSIGPSLASAATLKATPRAAGEAPGPVLYFDQVSLGNEPAGPMVDVAAAARAISRAHLVGETEVLTLWSLPTDHYDSRAYPGPGGHLYEGGLSSTFRRLNSDGTVAWERQATSNGLSALSAVAPDGNVFISRVSSVEGWDASGNLLWSNPISESLDGTCAAGPQGQCYIFDYGHLIALDGATGKKLWDAPMEHAWSDNPPIVGKDGTIYGQSRDGVVYAFRPDGTERWRYEGLKGKTRNENVIETHITVGDDGSVYFSAGKGFRQPGELVALDPQGKVKWTRTLDGEPSTYESPAVDSQGNVYAGTGRDSTEVVAWSADGTELWRKDIGPVLHLTGHPQGGAVVGIRGGDLHCFTADGMKQWTFHTGNILTQPAFGPGNELYTGSGKTLYAITAQHTTTEQRTAEAARQAEEDTKASAPAENATIQQDDGWVIIGSVRVPVRK